MTKEADMYEKDENAVNIKFLRLEEYDANNQVVDKRSIDLENIVPYIPYKHQYFDYNNMSTTRVNMIFPLVHPFNPNINLGRMMITVYGLHNSERLVELHYKAETFVLKGGDYIIEVKIFNYYWCNPCITEVPPARSSYFDENAIDTSSINWLPNVNKPVTKDDSGMFSKHNVFGNSLQLVLEINGRRIGVEGFILDGTGQNRRQLDLGNGFIMFPSVVEINKYDRSKNEDLPFIPSLIGLNSNKREWVRSRPVLCQKANPNVFFGHSPSKCSIALPKFANDITYVMYGRLHSSFDRTTISIATIIISAKIYLLLRNI